jgi:hypothetical protein
MPPSGVFWRNLPKEKEYSCCEPPVMKTSYMESAYIVDPSGNVFRSFLLVSIIKIIFGIKLPKRK